MNVRGRSQLASMAAGTLALFAGVQAQPASAQQLLWDWGGSKTVGGSGREVIRFNPQYGKGQIIVSFSDRKLYLITQPGEAVSYPIAIPREQSRWQGVLSVTQKRENPSWTPTPTMVKENPRLPRWVPGGHPMNPLGVRALYLGSSMYRIHGTDAPWTIGTAVSKGCIRLYNQDVLDLYPRVQRRREGYGDMGFVHRGAGSNCARTHASTRSADGQGRRWHGRGKRLTV